MNVLCPAQRSSVSKGKYIQTEVFVNKKLKKVENYDKN